MRKLLVLLLCLAMFLVAPVSAYAEDYVNTENGYYNSDMDIQCHSYSSFYITIPSALSQNEQGELTVSSPNIEDGYHVAVYVTNFDENGYISVFDQNYDTNHREGKAMLYVDAMPYVYSEDGLLCEFVDNDYIGSEATHRVAYTEAPGGMPHAGIYNGVICFRVECVPNE